MSSTRLFGQPSGWLRMALIMAGSGAVGTIVVLWLAQVFIGASSDGRLLDSVTFGDLVLLVLAMVVVGIPVYLALRRVGWGRRVIILALALWLAGYVVTWLVGASIGGIALPFYLLLWFMWGAVGSAIVEPRMQAVDQVIAASPMTAQPGPVPTPSRFGRIPSATEDLLGGLAWRVERDVAGVLPSEAPPEVRNYTVRAALERCLRDWWENRNTAGLDGQDADDLRSFVALALHLAGGAAEQLDRAGFSAGLAARLRDPEAQAIHRAVLAALLDDWLANWNADGVDGPPVRG